MTDETGITYSFNEYEIAAYVGRVLKDESAFYQQKLLLFLSRLSPEMLAELEKVADEILSNDKKEQKD